MFCELPPGYQPSESEPFMNVMQKEYFRQKLLAWRDELTQHSLDTFHHLKEDSLLASDPNDQAALEDEISAELRVRDRERKLISKIDDALRKLEEGTYGYCEETGDPIGLKRLESRLVATLCYEAQQRHEQQERLRKG